MPPPSFLYLSIANPPPATVVAGQEYGLQLYISAAQLQAPGERRIVRKSNLQLEIRNIPDTWVRGGLLFPVELPDGESFLEVELVLTPTAESNSVLLEIGVRPGTAGAFTLLLQQEITVQGGQAPKAALVERRATLDAEVDVQPTTAFASLFIGGDAQRWQFIYRSPAAGEVRENVQAWANTTALSLEARFAADDNRDAVKGNGILIADRLPASIKAQLERLVQTGAVLQILDQTATDIPWEMIYLETATEQGFLGALCGVVRRVGATAVGEAAPATPGAAGFGEDTPLMATSLPLGDDLQPGEVLAFLADPEHLAGTDPEHLALQQLFARLCAGRDEFLAELNTQNAPVALVYVASHGNGVADAPNQATLWLATAAEIKAVQLLGAPLQLVVQAHPLIFVNACYSAQMGPIGGWDRFGLPSPFLRRQARGYLGAVGKVYTEFAAEFGKLFLERLQADGSEPVAQILRDLRAAAVQTASGLSQEEAGRYLLTTFMYVYYGMPLARVQVRQPAPGGQP